MSLIAHNALPSYQRLRQEGQLVIDADAAKHQDIRELHIGLLNMMPDKALEATERQFMRLVGQANPVAQIHVHPFSLPELHRSAEAQQHIDRYYDKLEQLQQEGLDGLIITGANVTNGTLSQQSFWEPLKRVIDWAATSVTSTLCSCLATHAVLEFRYQQPRTRQQSKHWGVFQHQLTNTSHPLVQDTNQRFDVPHSRWNDVSKAQFGDAGLLVLAESPEVGVHLATSPDGLRFVFFQGHPEYDTVSLLKEYKREVGIALQTPLPNDQPTPPMPSNYLSPQAEALAREYYSRQLEQTNANAAVFPEALIQPQLQNTWHDTAQAIISNWIGCIYQVTASERHKPFMDHINPQDPLGLRPSDS